MDQVPPLTPDCQHLWLLKKQDTAMQTTQAFPGNSSQSSNCPRETSHSPMCTAPLLPWFWHPSALSAFRNAFPWSFKSQPYSITVERCKKMQRSRQARNVAFHKRLKQPSLWPHLSLCKRRNVLLQHGSTVLPAAPLLPTLLRPGHASLGVLLPSGHEKHKMSKKK